MCQGARDGRVGTNISIVELGHRCDKAHMVRWYGDTYSIFNCMGGRVLMAGVDINL